MIKILLVVVPSYSQLESTKTDMITGTIWRHEQILKNYNLKKTITTPIKYWYNTLNEMYVHVLPRFSMKTRKNFTV